VWAIQKDLLKIYPNTVVHGGRGHRTCPEPTRIENSKTGTFQDLNKWEMLKL